MVEEGGEIGKEPSHRIKGVVFAVTLFCFQVMTCFIYAFRIGYNQDTKSQFAEGDVMLVVGLTILAIVGFGLMNSYITSASFSGMAMSLLIFAMTIQHYFLIRAFWYKAGLYSPNSQNTFSVTQFNKISFANINKDPYSLDDLDHASISDAITCAICMILTFSTLVGRIQFLETFLLTFFGTFFYELNFQLFFRLRISDIGYGMRLFLFAGLAGFFAGILLEKRQTTLQHLSYKSSYSSRSLGLLGFVFTFCAFPFLCVAQLYHTTVNQGYMAYIAPLNMYLALGAGALGTYAACCLGYRKIQVYDIIFTGLNGGIVFSSSADITRNPAAPIGSGFIIGLLGSFFHSKFSKRINKRGVFHSLPVFHRLIIPGTFAGILSAILIAIDQVSTQGYIKNVPEYRTNAGQGGFQIVGILLTAAIASFTGALLGLIYKFINNNQPEQQFNDNVLYISDQPDNQDLAPTHVSSKIVVE